MALVDTQSKKNLTSSGKKLEHSYHAPYPVVADELLHSRRDKRIQKQSTEREKIRSSQATTFGSLDEKTSTRSRRAQHGAIVTTKSRGLESTNTPLGQSDLTINPLATDLAKGTICVKKKKLPGTVYKVASAGNQVWCATNEGLKVLSQNARELRSFSDHKYTNLCGVSNRMFASTDSGLIVAFDTQTVDPIFNIQTDLGANAVICYSEGRPASEHHTAIPAGVWVFSNGHLRLYDVQSGEVKRQLFDDSVKNVSCIAAVGAEQLWLGCSDGSIHIFRPEEADEVVQVLKKGPESDGHNGPVLAITVVDHEVWTGSEDARILVWDAVAHSPSVSKILTKHSAAVTSLSTVGNRVWSGSRDSKVGIWARGGELIGVLPGVHQDVVAIATVGLFVWIATRPEDRSAALQNSKKENAKQTRVGDEMLRVFISQGLIEAAQDDLHTYSLSSFGELKRLFTHTMAENEHLCLLLRSLKTQLMRSDAWQKMQQHQREEYEEQHKTVPDNLKPDFLDPRSAKKDIDIRDLIVRLHELEKSWSNQRQQFLCNWSLPQQVREVQNELRANDRIKKELAELRGLFAEVEKSLLSERDRTKHELEQQKAVYAKNKHEIETLTSKHTTEKAVADAEIERLTNETASLQGEINEKSEALKTLKAELSDMQKSKATFESEIARYENQLKANEKESSELSILKKKLEATVDSQRETLNTLKQQQADNENALRQQKGLTETFKTQLKQKQDEYQRLATEVNAAVEAIKQQNSRKQELASELENEKRKLSDVEKQIQGKCCLVL